MAAKILLKKLRNMISRASSRKSSKKLSQKQRISIQRIAHKPIRKSSTMQGKRNLANAIIAKRLRMARKNVRVISRITVRAQPVQVKKEIMMPAPWSRVEKYKKVRKENDFYYKEK